MRHCSRSMFVVVSLVLMALLVTQCAPAVVPTAVPTAQPKPAVEAKEPIRFAAMMPMTGNDASGGEKAKRGIELAMAEINAAGGIAGRQVVVDFFDDRGDPKEGTTVAQKIVADGGYFAVMGSPFSVVQLAIGPILEEAKTSRICGNCANPTLTKQGWKYFSRTLVDDSKNGPFLARATVNTLGAKRIAIFSGQDEWSRGYAQAIVDELGKLGAEVVAQEWFTPGVDKDFSAQLTRIAQVHPDALIQITNATDGAMVCRQAQAAGLENVKMVGTGGLQDQNFLNLAGDAANGIVLQVLYDPYSSAPLTKAFTDKWVAKYGELPGEFEVNNYELLFIYKQAIEAGATKENLTEYVHKVVWNGPSGLTKFDEFGDQTEKTPMLMTVKNGQWASYTGGQ